MTATERTASYLGGAGSPLVLLHGVNLSWPIWTPVLAGLEEHHTVFAPTLAGHRGGPALPPGPVGLGPVADAVERQLDAFGWTHAHLVGNSLGGWLAVELAARGRATTVTAFSPAGAWATMKDYRRLARLMRLAGRSAHWKTPARLAGRPRGRRALLRSAMNHADRISGAEVLEMLADTRDCTTIPGLLAWLDQNPRLPQFDIGETPARIYWAERDRTIPWDRYGAAFCTLVPSAEQHFLPGVGHVPTYDDPALVVRSILDVTAPATVSAGEHPEN